MLSNQNRYRAPPLAAEKGRLNKMTPAGSLFRRESGSLLERCKQLAPNEIVSRRGPLGITVNPTLKVAFTGSWHRHKSTATMFA
jgi:hypothetical protein